MGMNDSKNFQDSPTLVAFKQTPPPAEGTVRDNMVVVGCC